MRDIFMKKDGNLYEAMRYSAQCAKGEPALIYMKKTITYDRLLAETDRLAEALNRYNISAGEVVTVCLPNIPEAVYLFYAINKIGAVAHLVHPLTTQEQMEENLKDIKTRLIFTLGIYSQNFIKVCEQKNINLISCDPSSHLNFIKHTVYNALNKTAKAQCNIAYAKFVSCPSFNNSAPKDRQSIDAAVLLHSGGTCGKPKVIALSNHAINSLASHGTNILDIDTAKGKYMLSVLPMFHGFGMCMGIHAMLCHCGCNVIMPKFNRNETISLLEKGKINFIIGVPILYEALLAHPKFCGDKLKNIDVAFVGGDFVAKTLMKRFDERLALAGGKGRLFEGYGLTETVTVCAVNLHASNRDGSVGRPLAGIEIEAFDFSASAKKLDRGMRGEFGIASPTLMDGYLFDETSNVFFEYEGKKWVRTGDYGSVDQSGFVFFLQRLKRIIKVNGIPVYPSEIENLAMELDGITNVCALEVDDADRGSMVKLFVQTAKSSPQLKESLAAKIESRLGKYAVPREIVFMEKLPTTSVGKVNAEQLKKL